MSSTSPGVPNVIQPGQTPQPNINVYDQQSGCGIKLYSNAYNGYGTRQIFYEIMDCNTSRSTLDIAGSFSFTLNASEAWDEIISPNDFIRIFMGDQMVQYANDQVSGSYNFAWGSLDQAGKIQNYQSSTTANVLVPIPGLGPIAGRASGTLGSNKEKAMNFLVMYERFIGKIDRIEKLVSPPGKEAGTETVYVVTGRSLGAILHDIALYYNNYLPGFDPVDLFKQLDLTGGESPDYYVYNLLKILLSVSPIPQWQLPQALMNDLNFGNVQAENLAEIQSNIQGFQKNIAASEANSSLTVSQSTFVTSLQQLLNEVNNSPTQYPFLAFCTDGILPCAGEGYNLGMLNSTNSGAFDRIKALSNPPFNELWIDLCPGGDPEGGPTTSERVIPTIVMRQYPYDIPSIMTNNVAPYLQYPAQRVFTDFPQVNQTGTDENGNVVLASKSLFDIISNAVSVFGPMSKSTQVSSNAITANVNSQVADVFTTKSYTPSLMRYEVGRASHDQVTAWICNGEYLSSMSDPTSIIPVVEANGFLLDVDGVRRYGFKVMEVTTMYYQAAPTKTGQNPFQSLAALSGVLANWYFLNPYFLNGRLVCRFLPDARLGIPCKYFETAISPTNPYPKMELFYVQGVDDSYVYGRPIMTTLTVVRGIRYNLAQNAQQSQQILALAPVALARANAAFAGLTGS